MCESEGFRERLRLTQAVEEAEDVRLAALRGEIDRGLGDLDRGLGVDGEEAFGRVLDEIERGD